jgi:hypothetical protein
MDFPTPIVEAGFTAGPDTGIYGVWDDPGRGLWDTATWAPDALWSDITPYVHTFTTQRGLPRADTPILRYEAGASSAALNNSDRRFDPTNLTGPYVAAGATQVTPMRAIRYRAIYAGVTYELWRGNADAWQIVFEQPRYSSASVTATDGFKVLAAYNRMAGGAVGAGEGTGARITRILNSVAWPAGARIIAAGDSVVQATTLAGDALAELQLVADSELGEFYLGGAGHAVFRNRRAVLTDIRSAAPVAKFGDQTSTAETTINLALYPSSETTVGFTPGGFAHPPTITQDTTHAFTGTQAALVTWVTASGGDLPQASLTGVAALTPGKVYSFSAYVWVPSGSPAVAIFADGKFGDQTSTVNDAWQRLTWTGAVSAAPYFQVWPAGSVTTAGQQVWLDSAQVEAGATVTAYCDGDQPGCQWDGVAHASVSRRLPELPYTDVTVAYDDTQLANLVRITRVGGATQTSQDTTSQAQYLVHTYDRDDLVVTSDAEAANVAGWVRYQSSQPELRFATLTVNPRRDPARLFPQVLGREVGDRITVILRPPGGGAAIERDAFIRGIAHDVDLRARRTWVTTFVLQSATRYTFGVWDSNTLGLWDESAFAY